MIKFVKERAIQKIGLHKNEWDLKEAKLALAMLSVFR